MLVTLLLILPAVIGVVTGPGVMADDALAGSQWPKAHCDAKNTGRSPYTAGHNDGQLKWSVNLSEELRGSPVIGSDGTIYITAEGNLLALDRDGSERWSYEVGTGYSTPAIGNDGTIFVMTNYNGLYAIRDDGTLKWTADVSSRAPLAIGKDGNLYLGDSSRGFLCVSSDGEELWLDDRTTYFTKGIAAIRGNGNVVLGHEEYRLVTEYDASGNTVWEVLASGLVKAPTVMASDGTVYVCSYTIPGGHLEAFDTEGQRLWHLEFEEWTDGSPCIGPDGTIYVMVRDDRIHAIDPDGVELWSVDIGRYGWGNPVVSDDGTVFVGNVDGNVTAIRDGEVRWTFKAGDNVYSTPALDEHGILYFGCDDGKLYALGDDRTLADTVMDHTAYIVVVALGIVVGTAVLVRFRRRGRSGAADARAATQHVQEPHPYEAIYGTHHDRGRYDQERPGQLPPPP